MATERFKNTLAIQLIKQHLLLKECNWLISSQEDLQDLIDL